MSRAPIPINKELPECLFDMSLRTVAVTGAAVLCGALFMLAIDSGVAGASWPVTDGFTTLTPTGSYTAGTPYGDGQTITVNVSGGHDSYERQLHWRYGELEPPQRLVPDVQLVRPAPRRRLLLRGVR